MKLLSIGYVPPPKLPCATAFYENMRQFKCKHERILLSDHDWPDTFKLKLSPEAPYADGKPHKFAINNVLFFTCLRVAAERGYSHMIYLEADCRVGCDYWDDIMFAEHFSVGRPLVCSGSLACYNPANYSLKAMQRWEKLVVDNAIKWQKKPYDQCRLNMPIATYGWKGASEKSPSCVFPNGALSILNVEWMKELFPLMSTGAVKLAETQGPFDMAIGILAWEKLKEDAYEVMAHLNCIYSGYSDVITTESERQEMLTSGRVCAAHQFKSDWRPK